MYMISAIGRSPVRGADGRADDGALGQRRIEDPPLSESLLQPCRRAEHAAELPHVLAEQADRGVAIEFLLKRLANCADHFQPCHVFHLSQSAHTHWSTVCGSGSGLSWAKRTASSSSRSTSAARQSSSSWPATFSWRSCSSKRRIGSRRFQISRSSSGRCSGITMQCGR